MTAIMDKFIKSIPLIVAFSLSVIIWQEGDSDFSNVTSAIVCASVVVMLAAIIYIILDYFEQSVMPAGKYILLMFSAGVITFAVLYACLQYFYT
ncbi:hypothetical protein DEU42_101208 [Flavobacterium sp. AG291]|nr:hypothetical protein DEU42_101208 [Flavobacterium sp. AG291]